MSHPKLKGIRWLDDELPDLIAIKITLVNKSIQDLDIPGMEIPETYAEMKVDLSKLAAVSPWYPKGSDDPAENACLVDIEGVANFVADTSEKDIIQAWIYYKRCKK
jgi:hypothetical protein